MDWEENKYECNLIELVDKCKEVGKCGVKSIIKATASVSEKVYCVFFDDGTFEMHYDVLRASFRERE